MMESTEKTGFWREVSPGERRAQRDREAALVAKFILVYCRHRHAGLGGLCSACQDLLTYALDRLAACPYDPKPPCKRCPTHCYQAEMRTRIGQVMRYSGMHFVRRGRLDWLIRYFMISKPMDRRKTRRWRQKPTGELPAVHRMLAE